MILSFDNAALIDRIVPQWLVGTDAIGRDPEHLERLLDAARQEGYERGHELGRAEGYDAGYEAGYECRAEGEHD